MFSDLAYFAFLAVAAIAYAVTHGRNRSLVLAVAGLSFYTYYAGIWAVLLLSLSLFSWFLLFGKKPSTPKAIAGATLVVIVLSVAVLATFKYAKFFGSAIGLHIVGFATIPLALSFFTFEFIHVAAEKRRGTIEHIAFADYQAFIFFFPTMIAGPIKRWEHFGVCLKNDRAKVNDVVEGLFRIALGLTKKLVIADNLNLIIDVIGKPKPGGNPTAYIFAILLYGIRIWLDFAGYSDIAIGSARLFGIIVPENFLHPYRQTNIASFWRHWHVSLTMWFTDYVFIPLGGSRATLARACVNVMIVMTLSGLWHGANWNFVLWGIWHGCLLVGLRLHRAFLKPKLPEKMVTGTFAKVAGYAITMACVWFGWLLFMWPIQSVGTFLKMLVHRGG